MILAVIGIVLFAAECIRKRTFSISETTLASGVIAIIFSVWCLYSITANGTNDSTYANYFMSFATWIGGGYCVCWLLRQFEGRIELEDLIFILTLVCTAQCILALLIDSNPSFQQSVDKVIVQDQEFIQKVNRLYGIGASLDTAGVRFSVILVLMAHQLSTFGKAMNRPPLAIFYFVAYALITIAGSIIARTTWVGSALGLLYMALSYLRVRHGFITTRQAGFWILLAGIILTATMTSVWLYNHNPDFRQNLRFGFEGFFNWAETGVFRTDSTDKLNRIMWVWPTDTRTWIIGTGLFADWIYGTDIGYCRFVLYCGLVGLVIFSIFFIFNGLSIIRLFPGTTYLALILIALTFIIWMKVSTDIFFIYALLFSTASLQEKPREAPSA